MSLGHHVMPLASKGTIGPAGSAMELKDVQDALIRNLLMGDEHNPIHPQKLLFYVLSHIQSAEAAALSACAFFEKFGSISAILGSSFKNIEGAFAGDLAGLAFISAIRQIVTAALREPLESGPILSDIEKLHDYLRSTLGSENKEMVRILFLDRGNRLIRDELHSTGTVNTTHIYPREIVARILDLNATALIIVHNHPSGNPEHSDDDVRLTNGLARVLFGIGVRLHDSIIVGRQKCESLRSLGLIGDG